MKEPVEVDSNTSSDIDTNIDIDSDDSDHNGNNRTTEGNPSSRPTRINAIEIGRIRTNLRLWCAFTTQSMAIAYASSEDERPQVLFHFRLALRAFVKRYMIVIHPS